MDEQNNSAFSFFLDQVGAVVELSTVDCIAACHPCFRYVIVGLVQQTFLAC